MSAEGRADPDEVTLAQGLRELAASNRELAQALPSRGTARVLAAVAVVAMIAALGSLVTVLDIRHTQTDNHKTLAAQTQELATDNHILQLVIGAVGPAATAQSNAALTRLVTYLVCVVGDDTGHSTAPCGAP